MFFLVADALGMLFVCGALTTLLWYACCGCSRRVAATRRKVVATTTQTEVRQEHGQTQTEAGPEHGQGREAASEMSILRELLELMLRDELRVVLRLRSMHVSGLKAELVERLLHDHSAEKLTNEACAAMVFVARRCGSRPDGLALRDDAGAFEWIVKACKEFEQGGHKAAAGVRRRAARS